MDWARNKVLPRPRRLRKFEELEDLVNDLDSAEACAAGGKLANIDPLSGGYPDGGAR